MLSIRDRVVLVTGAHGGIGAALVSAFAESDATVIGSDRATQRPGAAAAYYDFDVTDEAAATDVVSEVVSAGASRARSERAAQLPMQRFARSNEVSSAALFLTHPQNRYITGVSLDVAGGRAPRDRLVTSKCLLRVHLERCRGVNVA